MQGARGAHRAGVECQFQSDQQGHLQAGAVPYWKGIAGVFRGGKCAPHLSIGYGGGHRIKQSACKVAIWEDQAMRYPNHRCQVHEEEEQEGRGVHERIAEGELAIEIAQWRFEQPVLETETRTG